MRVTKIFQRLKEEFYDASFMAQRGMWHLMEQRRRVARNGGLRDSKNVVRECKAVA